ncbi:hypothetical protein KUV61_04295 [Nocardioides marinus]|nr:hypothetical protein [Nocardioides marinus]
MDFNAFDSVSAAEKGAELHIRHPATGKPLFDNPKDPFADNGKPCIVIVKGAEAPSVREARRALQKARAQADGEPKAAEADKDEDLSFDDLHERMVEALSCQVCGFKNIHRGDQPATTKDVEWFLNLNRFNAQSDEKSFAEQLAEFSSKRANYLGNGSAG